MKNEELRIKNNNYNEEESIYRSSYEAKTDNGS